MGRAQGKQQQVTALGRFDRLLGTSRGDGSTAIISAEQLPDPLTRQQALQEEFTTVREEHNSLVLKRRHNNGPVGENATEELTLTVREPGFNDRGRELETMELRLHYKVSVPIEFNGRRSEGVRDINLNFTDIEQTQAALRGAVDGKPADISGRWWTGKTEGDGLWRILPDAKGATLEFSEKGSPTTLRLSRRAVWSLAGYLQDTAAQLAPNASK